MLHAGGRVKIMPGKMTWKEMKAAYPDEWLLIVDVDFDEFGHLRTGTVERHSPDVDEIVKLPVINKPTAFRYTGESTFMGLRSHAQHDHHF